MSNYHYCQVCNLPVVECNPINFGALSVFNENKPCLLQPPISQATIWALKPVNNFDKRIQYGKCKWFNVARGFGIIISNNGGHEVFVHQSVIQMPGFRVLIPFEEVAFEYTETPKGLEATCVWICIPVESFSRHVREDVKRSRGIRCFTCGQFSNHFAKECPMGRSKKVCFFCKQSDHLKADCPKRYNNYTTLN